MVRSACKLASVALALGLFALVGESALAATALPGTTVHLTGGLTNQPPTCTSGVREAHFILNGLSPEQQAALVSSGTVVTATFSNGTNSGAFFEQGANDAAFVSVPMNSNTATVTDATFVVPTVPGVIDATHPLQYNEFNLSFGDCSGTTTTTTTTTTSTTGTSAVPELDSLVLFGAGALGLAGFAWYQRRRPRREA
jgi:hypothetical protein